MIVRTKVILDEETIQEWKSLIGNPEHEGCKSEKCDERWEIERTLFHGRVLSFISSMHRIQGIILCLYSLNSVSKCDLDILLYATWKVINVCTINK